jgi:hypothetical protein
MTAVTRLDVRSNSLSGTPLPPYFDPTYTDNQVLSLQLSLTSRDSLPSTSPITHSPVLSPLNPHLPPSLHATSCQTNYPLVHPTPTSPTHHPWRPSVMPLVLSKALERPGSPSVPYLEKRDKGCHCTSTLHPATCSLLMSTVNPSPSPNPNRQRISTESARSMGCGCPRHTTSHRQRTTLTQMA